MAVRFEKIQHSSPTVPELVLDSLLTAIVTDRGIVYPPFDVNLPKIMED